MTEIFDIKDDRIKEFLNLKFKKDKDLDNLSFIADSNKTVISLLNSNLPILKLLVTKEFYEDNINLIKSRSIDKDNIFIAPKSLMKEIIGFKIHGGIMALAKIPPQTLLNSLDKRIVIMNNVIDAENVGSIIRNSAAFNFNSIIVDKSTPHPYMRRVVRVSMGNIFNMKYYVSNNLIRDLEKLRALGYKIISIENNVTSESYLNFGNFEKFVLIFGNEGKGIDKEILDYSDKIYHIPILKTVKSINVSSASAIILNHLYNTTN